MGVYKPIKPRMCTRGGTDWILYCILLQYLPQNYYLLYKISIIYIRCLMEFQLILHKYHESLESEFNPFLLAFEWAALKLIFGIPAWKSSSFLFILGSHNFKRQNCPLYDVDSWCFNIGCLCLFYQVKLRMIIMLLNYTIFYWCIPPII